VLIKEKPLKIILIIGYYNIINWYFFIINIISFELEHSPLIPPTFRPKRKKKFKKFLK
jgi:hypothetical protein